MSKIATVLSLVTIISTSAMAQEIGQYSIVPMPRSTDQMYSSALIIDTKNGYVWEWISQAGSPNFIVYQGKAEPFKNTNLNGLMK